MATPPFGLQTSSPADTDIVSQFPANERTNRDEIQSWIEVDHDTNGNHTIVHMPYQSSAPATPSASIAAMYTDVNGNLVVKKSDGNVYYIGVPPGVVNFTAGSSADNGYVLANGQAISRTGVGAALFARIGTTYGVGDGSTTFNVPNVAGKAIFGKEAVATLLTSAAGGLDGGTLGATGGNQTYTMLRTDMPNITLLFHGQSSTLNITTNNAVATGGSTGSGFSSGGTYPQLVGSSIGGNVTPLGTIDALNGGVTQTAQKTVPPGIVLNAQIKL